MLTDYEADVYNRLMRGMPKRKMHYLGVERVRMYYATLASLAGVEPIKPVLLDIFDRSTYLRVNDVKNYRRYNYLVVDDYNFVEHL